MSGLADPQVDSEQFLGWTEAERHQWWVHTDRESAGFENRTFSFYKWA